MKRGMEWYKREPRAMIDAKRAANGGKGMTVRQAAVYDLVTDLIYEGAGETPNNPQHIASHFSDMGTRAARETISCLIGMGKLREQGGMLINPRASEQAQSRSEISEARAVSGRAGGIQSGKTRRKLSGNSPETQRKLSGNEEFSGVQCNKNNNLSEAKASSKTQPEKRREERDIGGGGTRARDDLPDQTECLREQILGRIGADPVSGLSGPTGKILGTFQDMTIANRWKDDLGLTDSEIVTIVGEVMRAKPDGPPASFRYFDQAMQRAAGAKSKPKLTPIEGGSPDVSDVSAGSARRQIQQAQRRGPRGGSTHSNFLAAFAGPVPEDD